MVDAPIQDELRKIQFLLVLGVSFLGGLVFGRDYGAEVSYAVGSFVGLGLLLVAANLLRSDASE